MFITIILQHINARCPTYIKVLACSVTWVPRVICKYCMSGICVLRSIRGGSTTCALRRLHTHRAYCSKESSTDLLKARRLVPVLDLVLRTIIEGRSNRSQRLQNVEQVLWRVLVPHVAPSPFITSTTRSLQRGLVDTGCVVRCSRYSIPGTWSNIFSKSLVSHIFAENWYKSRVKYTTALLNGSSATDTLERNFLLSTRERVVIYVDLTMHHINADTSNDTRRLLESTLRFWIVIAAAPPKSHVRYQLQRHRARIQLTHKRTDESTGNPASANQKPSASKLGRSAGASAGERRKVKLIHIFFVSPDIAIRGYKPRGTIKSSREPFGRPCLRNKCIMT